MIREQVRQEKLQDMALSNKVRKWIHENKVTDLNLISSKFKIPVEDVRKHVLILKRCELIN